MSYIIYEDRVCKICDNTYKGWNRNIMCNDCKKLFPYGYNCFLKKIKKVIIGKDKRNNVVRLSKWQFPKICKQCNNYFWCKVVTDKCEVCRIKKKKGSNKGKTYLQIYGTKIPKCGFKKGLLNPNFTHRRQIIEHSPQNKMNKYGEFYRSKLEVQFSEFLHEHNINFEYEYKIKMNNNHYKYIDFRVGNVLIEITGLAYKAWQEKFFNQIKVLRDTINNPIIIITYEEKYEMLMEHRDWNIFPEKLSIINNTNKLLSLINFCQDLYDINKIIEGGIYVNN